MPSTQESKKLKAKVPGRFGEQRAEHTVKVSEVRPNAWNYNKQTKLVFEKEKASIEEFGFVIPPVVRSANESGPLGFYEVIDGAHRLQACLELGYEHIPVNDFGMVADRDAKKLTIILNETTGTPQYEKLGALLANLADDGFDDLLVTMPFPEAELRAMIQIPEHPADIAAATDPLDPTADTEEFRVVEVLCNDEQMATILEAVDSVLEESGIAVPKRVKMALGLERLAREHLRDKVEA